VGKIFRRCAEIRGKWIFTWKLPHQFQDVALQKILATDLALFGTPCDKMNRL
jgi:hypothetical protein